MNGQDAQSPSAGVDKHSGIAFSQRNLDYGQVAQKAYPTDGKERQKLQKKAGHEPKKRKFDVQDHHDDRGNSLAGIAGSEKDLW